MPRKKVSLCVGLGVEEGVEWRGVSLGVANWGVVVTPAPGDPVLVPVPPGFTPPEVEVEV